MFFKVLSLVVISALSTSALALSTGKEVKSSAEQERARIEANKALAQGARGVIHETVLAEIQKNQLNKDNEALANVMLINAKATRYIPQDAVKKIFADASKQAEVVELYSAPEFKGSEEAESALAANVILVAENKSKTTAKEQIEVAKELKSNPTLFKAWTTLLFKSLKQFARGATARIATKLAAMELMLENAKGNSSYRADLSTSDMKNSRYAKEEAKAEEVVDELANACKAVR